MRATEPIHLAWTSLSWVAVWLDYPRLLLVAQAGRSVILFEQAGEVGGRAATQVRQGISFNLGPHALYFLGHAFRLLRELRRTVHGTGSQPGKSRLLLEDARIPPAPRAGFTGWIAAFQPARERAIDPVSGRPFASSTAVRLTAFLYPNGSQKTIGSGNAARFLLAFFRVSTYADDADRLSAGVAIDQLRLALGGNVWYVDGGWQKPGGRAAGPGGRSGSDDSNRDSGDVGAAAAATA